MEAARTAEFDPNAAFRGKYRHPPFDLLVVVEIKRVGFENLIKANSISPPLDEPVFLAFTSAKSVPLVDDYFSLSGGEASFVNPETLTPKAYETRVITPEIFGASGPELL